MLLIGTLEMKFSEIEIELQWFSLKKMHVKLSANGGHFCLSHNVLTLVCVMLFYFSPNAGFTEGYEAYITREYAMQEKYIYVYSHLHIAHTYRMGQMQLYPSDNETISLKILITEFCDFFLN